MNRTLLMLALGLVVTAGALPLASCSTLGYYSQAVGGQLSLMRQARPIDEVIADQGVPPSVREKLKLAQQARLFSRGELHLPDNRSYRSYVDVGSPAVVWNVIAAPAFSVEPKQWCYPVAGCMSYRGYFSRSEAKRYADQLRSEGYDVHVAGASAYSTLGWFEDPILSTMLRRSEQDLVATIFHELAHQQLYVAGDSAFNEAYAVAVAEEGMRRWYKDQPEVYARYLEKQERLRAAAALLLETRVRLAALYEEPVGAEEKRERKRAIFDDLHASYAAMKASWGGDDSFDGWFPQEINNAHLALVDTYQGLVPAFKALLAQEEGDLSRFYRAAETVGKLAPAARRARLLALLARPLQAAVE